METGIKQWGVLGGRDLWDSQEMWAEGKRRLQKVFCFRAEDETAGVIFKIKRRDEDL